MPITYEIDQSRQLVRTTCTGFIVFEDVMAHFTAMERDPRRAGRFNVLLDLRGVTSMPDTGQLRQAAERIDPAKSDLQFGACAIVAVDPERIGIGRLFGVFARARFLDVFVASTVAEAEQWLELHAPGPHRDAP
jgi:hypothetical protein